jgi:hypothetical protein
MEDKTEEEEEVMFVNTVQQEEDGWQEPDDSWLELDKEEGGQEAGVYYVDACPREDDTGLEDEMEHPHDAAPPPGGKGAAAVRWWSPGPQRLQLKQHLPPGASPDNDLFLAMFLVRLPPSMHESVGAGNHTTAAAMVKAADALWDA